MFMRPILIIVSLFICSLAAPAQKRVETGFLNRSLVLNKLEYRYQVYVPREFSKAQKWPVIVALHGGGEYGNDGLKQTQVGLATAVRLHPERFPAIIVFPQAKPDGTPGWQLDGGKAAMQALDNAVKEFNGDRSRLYLTGYSAGGNGTWFLGSRYADRFAALVVVCGFVSDFKSPSNGIMYPAIIPSVSRGEIYPSLAAKVARIPIWILHGNKDDIVLPEDSRQMEAALKKVGADVRYTEIPGANHNAWDPSYGRADVIEWMLKQRK